jgi:hypothetical protein
MEDKKVVDPDTTLTEMALEALQVRGNWNRMWEEEIEHSLAAAQYRMDSIENRIDGLIALGILGAGIAILSLTDFV